MKKTILVWATVMAAGMLALSGCGKKETGQAGEYTNLADKESRKSVVGELEACGVTKEQTATLEKWAEDYHEITAKSYSYPKGFTALPESGMDYSSILMDDSAESYSYLQASNCRLTAFNLIKNQLTTAGTGNDTDLWLMFDIEAIDTMPEYQLTKEERAGFLTLFNQVSVEGTSTLEEHEEKIQEAWKERDIQISGDKLSLISVYLHAPEDQARFVGHTGVLADTKEGLLFVEKYSAMDPFQATYFKDRAELKEYLLARPDLYGDKTELAPIIMENGNVME